MSVQSIFSYYIYKVPGEDSGSSCYIVRTNEIISAYNLTDFLEKITYIPLVINSSILKSHFKKHVVYVALVKIQKLMHLSSQVVLQKFVLIAACRLSFHSALEKDYPLHEPA